MASPKKLVLSTFLVIYISVWMLVASSENTNEIISEFDQNYKVTWGFDHVLATNQGRDILLSMDKSSGAGFASKLSYGSGFFRLRIKLPDRDSAGVVTAFYLTSEGDEHDELDFEFLGNREGKPYTLQTNVFANGKGDREQKTRLWFDPTLDFHTYKILWNPYQIVFFVDNIPIRELKNNVNATVGAGYFPSKAMRIDVSLWNGESWATDGGKTKIDWSYAPFKAHFRGFGIDGCSAGVSSLSCGSDAYFWNAGKYRRLNAKQRRDYENVRKLYMNYDYCFDKQRYPHLPPECLNAW